MDTDALRQRIEGIRWWHTMELAPGVWTRGAQGAPRDGTADTLKRLHLPASLAGKSVLDVGAWDGFFSFEAERRGAARVLATDQFSWGGGGWGTQDGFRLAREALRSKVEDLRIDPMELTPERTGTFDVVLCLGVLYHLRHPLLGLMRVAAVCKELLILETYVDLRLGDDFPAMAFYPGDELDGDPTNWWGPNQSGVEALLRTVGFTRITAFRDESLEPSRWPWLRRQRWYRRWFPSGRRGTRITFHARR
jgi:tRNA (mo5U34)-methyltransferase